MSQFNWKLFDGEFKGQRKANDGSAAKQWPKQSLSYKWAIY